MKELLGPMLIQWFEVFTPLLSITDTHTTFFGLQITILKVIIFLLNQNINTII
jgi:hypothetical protein